MGPGVHHRVDLEPSLEPQVGRHVLVVRRQVLRLVQRLQVLGPSAVGLRQQHHPPHVHRGDHELQRAVALHRHDVRLRRRPPVTDHVLAEVLGQLGEPSLVLIQRDQGRAVVRQQRVQLPRRPAGNVAPSLDDPPLQPRQVVPALGRRPRRVARGLQVAQQPRQRAGHVEVARAHVLATGRVVPIHERHPPLRGGGLLQLDPPPRPRRQHLDPLGDRARAHRAAATDLAPPHHRVRRQARQLRHRELPGHLAARQPLQGVAPLRERAPVDGDRVEDRHPPRVEHRLRLGVGELELQPQQRLDPRPALRVLQRRPQGLARRMSEGQHRLQPLGFDRLHQRLSHLQLAAPRAGRELQDPHTRSGEVGLLRLDPGRPVPTQHGPRPRERDQPPLERGLRRRHLQVGQAQPPRHEPQQLLELLRRTVLPIRVHRLAAGQPLGRRAAAAALAQRPPQRRRLGRGQPITLLVHPVVVEQLAQHRVRRWHLGLGARGGAHADPQPAGHVGRRLLEPVDRARQRPCGGVGDHEHHRRRLDRHRHGLPHRPHHQRRDHPRAQQRAQALSHLRRLPPARRSHSRPSADRPSPAVARRRLPPLASAGGP